MSDKTFRAILIASRSQAMGVLNEIMQILHICTNNACHKLANNLMIHSKLLIMLHFCLV